MKAKTAVYIQGGSLAIYRSVKKRLRDVGHRTVCGAGFWMLLTSATEKQARAVCAQSAFEKKLSYRKPICPIDIP